MPNWERIEELRDHLVALDKAHKQDRKKHQKFNMRYWVKLISGKFKRGDIIPIERIRKNGASCGFAACLAGDALLLFGRKNLKFKVDHDNLLCLKNPNGKDMSDVAADLLDLTADESRFMFFGHWSTPKSPSGTVFWGLLQYEDRDYFKAATHKRAIKYLTLALEKRTLFVKWDGSGATGHDWNYVRDNVQTYNT